jgi:hypothetical protein
VSDIDCGDVVLVICRDGCLFVHAPECLHQTALTQKVQRRDNMKMIHNEDGCSQLGQSIDLPGESGHAPGKTC